MDRVLAFVQDQRLRLFGQPAPERKRRLSKERHSSHPKKSRTATTRPNGELPLTAEDIHHVIRSAEHKAIQKATALPPLTSHQPRAPKKPAARRKVGLLSRHVTTATAKQCQPTIREAFERVDQHQSFLAVKEPTDMRGPSHIDAQAEEDSISDGQAEFPSMAIGEVQPLTTLTASIVQCSLLQLDGKGTSILSLLDEIDDHFGRPQRAQHPVYAEQMMIQKWLEEVTFAEVNVNKVNEENVLSTLSLLAALVLLQRTQCK